MHALQSLWKIDSIGSLQFQHHCPHSLERLCHSDQPQIIAKQSLQLWTLVSSHLPVFPCVSQFPAARIYPSNPVRMSVSKNDLIENFKGFPLVP